MDTNNIDNAKELIKSLINWKIINWLLYKLTPYADKGYVDFTIMVDNYPVYSMSENFEPLYEFSLGVEDYIYKACLSEGFTYEIDFNNAPAEKQIVIYRELEKLIDSNENLEMDYSIFVNNVIYFLIIKEEV